LPRAPAKEDRMSEQRTRGSENNPWKTAVIGGGVAALIFMATGAVIAYLQDDPTEAEIAAEAPAAETAPATAAGPPPPVASAPPASVVEDCNRYAAAADRSEGEIAKKGLLGGALGAGVGAAGGAIADGGEGAGKGAGIGALVGAVGGSLYGLNEENQRTEAARAAYRDCLERQGY
jgi:hypothetical protein